MGREVESVEESGVEWSYSRREVRKGLQEMTESIQTVHYCILYYVTVHCILVNGAIHCMLFNVAVYN